MAHSIQQSDIGDYARFCKHNLRCRDCKTRRALKIVQQPSAEAWLLRVSVKLGCGIGWGGLTAEETQGALISGQILLGGLL